MAKARFGWFLLLFLLFWSASWLQASPRIVKVGVFEAPPLVLIQKGKPAGLFIDLIEEFARTNGWSLEYVEAPWAQQLAALEKGDIDLLPSIGYTKERESRFDFSQQPVFIDSGVLFAGPRLVIHTLFDLEGKKVAAVRKTIFTDAFLANLAAFGVHCDLVLTDNNQQVFEALVSGKADAGVTIYSLGTYLARNYSVSLTPISFSPISLQFGVPKGRNSDLLQAIDQGMSAMRGDAQSLYSRSYRTWTVPPDTNAFLPWLWWGLAALGGGGLLLGIWTVLLRREVAAQTEHLQEEKEKLAVTLRSIGDGVITTDIDGHVQLMNTVAEGLCGWTQAEAIGKPLETVFEVIEEGSQRPKANPIAQVLATGQAIELTNHSILVSRDGTKRSIADSGAPIRDRSGKILGVVLVFRDMTEKKKILDALQKSDKLNSLGVLAGGIAHDFNNLLAGVFGYMALAKQAGQGVPEVVRYLDKALSVSHRAKGLAHQLLTFSTGGLPQKKMGNLEPLIRTSISFAGSGSNVQCDVHIPEDLWSCDFDQDQIGQVLDNLIINARQAMPGGGRLIVEAANIALAEGQIPRAPSGNFVRVSFVDEGVGIPNSLQGKIFDPFFTTKESGHGLGLAVCNSIVESHGGAIEFESVVGKGTTFRVYLPASQGVSDLTVAPKPLTHRGYGTIVLMDDEEFIREIVEVELRIMGYEVIAVDRGEAVLEIFSGDEERKPRAVFLDLTVPGALGGRETARRLRELDPQLPIFALSGFSEDPVMAHPRDFGFTGSIRKPFDRAELSSLLDRFLPG